MAGTLVPTLREQKSLSRPDVSTATPTKALICLVYASSAVELFSMEQLVVLLERWRPKNAALGVTGMLLYKGGNLIQALEGEEHAVRGLYDTIRTDPRHQGVIKLTEHAIAERQFGDWSMAFRNLKDPSLRAVPGYSEFLNVPLDDASFASQPTRAQKLLSTFRQTM